MTERHRISYKQDFKGKYYKIHIEKRRADRLTLYLGEYIFMSQLNNEIHLKMFRGSNGRPSIFEQDIIDHIKIIKIVEIPTPKQPLFKPFK